MAFNTLIGPVKHGPCLQVTFKGPEGVFYLVEMFIMIQDQGRINIPHVGSNGEKTIIFFIPLYFLLIKLIVFLAVIFKEVMGGFLFFSYASVPLCRGAPGVPCGPSGHGWLT